MRVRRNSELRRAWDLAEAPPQIPPVPPGNDDAPSKRGRATYAPRSFLDRARAPFDLMHPPLRDSPCSRPRTCKETSSNRRSPHARERSLGRSQSLDRTCDVHTASRCGAADVGSGGHVGSTRKPALSRLAPSRCRISPLLRAPPPTL